VLLEVTSSAKARPEKVKRLQRVAALTKAARSILVTDGLEAREAEGVSVVPLRQFLLDPRRVVEGR
jgi:hypothetical protein